MKGNPELPFSASLQGVAIQSGQFSDLSHICCLLQKVDTLDVLLPNFLAPILAALQMIHVTFFQPFGFEYDFHRISV